MSLDEHAKTMLESIREIESHTSALRKRKSELTRSCFQCTSTSVNYPFFSQPIDLHVLIRLTGAVYVCVCVFERLAN